jgi:carotenoid 1,2-hydratase
VNPLDHCSINVALYGESSKRWAMTERASAAVERSATSFVVGPSALEWHGDALEIRLDEVCMPWPRRVRGRVRVSPEACPDYVATLDRHGEHLWSPIAVRSRVEVALDAPGVSWSGEGYLDTNAGSAPLESAFSSWHWSRRHDAGGTAVHYDIARRDGSTAEFALRFGADGSVGAAERMSFVELPATGWRIARRLRAAGEAQPVRTQLQTLEDTPFYARSLLQGADGSVVVHESLSLDRFRSPLVRWMLPFRMPRRGSGRAA